jgi:TPR repeat protein
MLQRDGGWWIWFEHFACHALEGENVQQRNINQLVSTSIRHKSYRTFCMRGLTCLSFTLLPLCNSWASAEPKQSTITQNTIIDRSNIKLIRERAEQGDPVAQFKFGHAYMSGRHVTEDSQLGLMWMHRSADQGYAPAESNLGFNFIEGKIVEKDTTKGIYYLRSACIKGDAGAKFYLSSAYFTGNGVDKDSEKAISLLKESAQIGLDKNNLVSEPAFFARMHLAKAYEFGFFPIYNVQVEKNIYLAITYYKLASDLNTIFNVPDTELGRIYSTKTLKQYDQEKSIFYFKKAASKGGTSSFGPMILIARLYYDENGKDRDLRSAEQWFLKAANAGSVLTQKELGDFYAADHPMRDNVSAYKWYRLSSIYFKDDELKSYSTKKSNELGKLLSEDELRNAEKQIRSWKPSF